MGGRKEALRRDKYWFDPTANQALARVDRHNAFQKSNLSYLIDHAPADDIKKFTGVVFEPKPKGLPSLSEARYEVTRLERRRVELITEHGRSDVQVIPEFQELTAQLFKARERNEELRRLRRS